MTRFISLPPATVGGFERFIAVPLEGCLGIEGELADNRGRVSRPLLVIFLTVFVNLVGFGIIIPLLPFYAETFGASPVVIGLLFAAYSLAQLAAAPVLGALSDRFGRRSEEHTSELQSQSNLVCRLLLEKKK